MDFLRRVNKIPSKTIPALQQSDLSNWSMVNITLRSHQLQGIRWLLERVKRGHGAILGDEMGLGKTLQAIGLILHQSAIHNFKGPVLVLCPLSVTNNWEAEFQRAVPHLTVINYCSGKEERQVIQQEIKYHVKSEDGSLDAGPFPFDVLLAHYEVVLKDTSFLQKIHWGCLIVDEGHRLKNPESLLYRTLTEVPINHRLILTGTPVQNNLKELYALLSFVAPKIFPINKLDSFITDFANVTDDTGLSDTLHAVLEPFILRRTKAEIQLDIPAKSEVILYTGLSAVQRKVYKSVLTKDLSVFGGSSKKNSFINILSNLRKCVNHPYLFNGIEPEPFELGEHIVEASGKLYLLDKLLELLKLKGHRVLVFSQMTRMLDIIQDYLGYRGYSYERLDGSVRGEERFIAIKNFAENEETFIFLLSTRAGGQGLNLVGADTIVFIDSDFNPQNDLQAAARAHRIGQTKPVKIIRLICRETVEEIILKRSEAKLSLTQAVIEGGQLSGGVATGTTLQLEDILKFGLDHILNSEENDKLLECEDLENILGATDDEGRWTNDIQSTAMDVEEGEAPENMYVYEGQDYSRASDKDRSTFDQLLAEQMDIDDEAMRERVLRSEAKIPLVAVDLSVRKRKQLTQEQLEERRRKREEGMLKRQKLMEEKERKREEERERKKQEMWRRNNYSSLRFDTISDSEGEESDDEGVGSDEGSKDISYILGDVTQPQCEGSGDAIIVHCVDNSGRWGRGGVFSALSTRSAEPERYYKKAGKMDDLSLGDVHVVPVDDIMSREDGRDMLALIVCQSRDSGGRLTGIKFPSLDTALKRIGKLAKQRNASVHLPRIGHSTPQFNWYGTERLIRKHLSCHGIPTTIYYYPRHGNITTNTSQVPKTTPLPAASTTQPGISTTELLPDFFTGVVVYFHNNMAEEDVKKLTRYIVAYEGRVELQPLPTVTHVVCQAKDTPPSGIHATTAMVLSSWIQDSVKEGKLMAIKDYIV